MRSKILKFGMPLMAFLLAIVFAFATESNVPKDDSLVQGYIWSNGDCFPTQKDCNNTGDAVCKINGNVVYRFDLGQTCSSFMTHRDL
ncbi:MAG: DUF6520 family protein [Aequorivita sp.]